MRQQVHGRALLPGAGLFELSAAAASSLCASDARPPPSEPFLVGVSMPAPCVLATPQGQPQLLLCSVYPRRVTLTTSPRCFLPHLWRLYARSFCTTEPARWLTVASSSLPHPQGHLPTDAACWHSVDQICSMATAPATAVIIQCTITHSQAWDTGHPQRQRDAPLGWRGHSTCGCSCTASAATTAAQGAEAAAGEARASPGGTRIRQQGRPDRLRWHMCFWLPVAPGCRGQLRSHCSCARCQDSKVSLSGDDMFLTRCMQRIPTPLSRTRL